MKKYDSGVNHLFRIFIHFLGANVCDDGEDVQNIGDELWHKNKIQKSYDACSEDYKLVIDYKLDDSGKFLIKISSNVSTGLSISIKTQK